MTETNSGSCLLMWLGKKDDKISVSGKRVLVAFGLTLNLLTTTIVAPPSNASKWQMGFNSAFKGLKVKVKTIFPPAQLPYHKVSTAPMILIN